MYNLKELYTSDTTLSQMIDWTPPSNELWGKIRSDPPPPWKSWKKLLSVRILHGPVRNLHGPVRHLHGPVRHLHGPGQWKSWWNYSPGPCRLRTGPCRMRTERNFLYDFRRGGGSDRIFPHNSFLGGFQSIIIATSTKFHNYFVIRNNSIIKYLATSTKFHNYFVFSNNFSAAKTTASRLYLPSETKILGIH